MKRIPRLATAVLLSWLLSSSLCPEVKSAWRARAGVPLFLSLTRPVVLETPFIRLRLAPSNGSYEIIDKQGNVTWRSNPYLSRFGEVTLNLAGKSKHANLDRCEVQRSAAGLVAMFRPFPGIPAAWIRAHITATQGGRWLEFRYEAAPSLSVESVRLLDEAFWVTNADKGYVVVPARMGLLLPSDSGRTFMQRFDTYENEEGCNMAMLGLAKSGAIALATWDDPYVEAQIRSKLLPAGGGVTRQIVSASLVLRKTAKSFRVWFGGKGDDLKIAKAYRQVAAEKGWLVRWEEKLKGHPRRAQLFGAIDFRVGPLLDRRMNEQSTKELSAHVNWTFDEVAQIAEHLKNDLGLDKVLFMADGWIRRSYDNQHPDILPAAPECGGSEALARCSRRVQRLGYIFCLHDNYQDIYRDSPAWDESFIMKNPDGSLARGGRWAGGQAYLICSRKGIELAERPQNLPGVKKLTEASSYFIDTTFAAPLLECFDPGHPLTRLNDMKWKQALADYARELFGIFGSEDGNEWAIAHSDFFEGLVGQSGRYFYDREFETRLGAVIIPLFELVYRDTISLYAKYGYDASQASKFVLYHIILGRPLVYGNIPPHLYWKERSGGAGTKARAGTGTPGDPGLFTRAHHGWAAGLHPLDRFLKNTYEILSPLNELTAELELTQHEFLTFDRKVQRSVFGSGEQSVEVIVNASRKDYRHQSRAGGRVVLPPYGFLIESPTFVAFHARSWNGLVYGDPPLFTLRSVDGKPLTNSGKIRVFHGFGDTGLKLRSGTRKVTKEALLSGPGFAPTQ